MCAKWIGHVYVLAVACLTCIRDAMLYGKCNTSRWEQAERTSAREKEGQTQLKIKFYSTYYSIILACPHMCGEYITLMQFRFIRLTPWIYGIIGFWSYSKRPTTYTHYHTPSGQSSVLIVAHSTVDQLLCDGNVEACPHIHEHIVARILAYTHTHPHTQWGDD